MARLQVNVDHVATVRQARRAAEPDPVHAAAMAELAGASGITVHLREDRRHIQDRDVEVLRRTVRTRLNLEMAASDAMVALACRLRPDQVTLVPERREELTTEGGLDVVAHGAAVRAAIATLRDSGIPVSLFIDASAVQIDAARDVGADAIELHTGSYARAGGAAIRQELALLAAGVARGVAHGLAVHAGHGLDYWNTAAIAAIAAVEELNIGHSIVSRAVLVGFDRAVRDMLAILRQAGPAGGGDA